MKLAKNCHWHNITLKESFYTKWRYTGISIWNSFQQSAYKDLHVSHIRGDTSVSRLFSFYGTSFWNAFFHDNHKTLIFRKHKCLVVQHILKQNLFDTILTLSREVLTVTFLPLMCCLAYWHWFVAGLIPFCSTNTRLPRSVFPRELFPHPVLPSNNIRRSSIPIHKSL